MSIFRSFMIAVIAKLPVMQGTQAGYPYFSITCGRDARTLRAFAITLILMFFVSTAQSADIDGAWTGFSGDGTFWTTFNFVADGNRLTGTMLISRTDEWEIQDGTIENDKISFTIPLGVAYKGMIDGDIMTLTESAKSVSGAESTYTVVLRRIGMSRRDFPAEWLSQEIVVISMGNPKAVLVSGIQNPETVKLADMSKLTKALQDIQRELQRMKEVVSVGILSPIPFSDDAVRGSQVRRAIRKTLPDKGQTLPGIPVVRARANSNGFDILGIQVIAGRSFTAKDAAEAAEWMDRRMKGIETAGAAIINQAAAQIIWPGEKNVKNVIGKVFYDLNAPFEVVGVVQNYHYTPDVYDNNEFIPTIYTPFEATGDSLMSGLQFLVKLRPGSFQKDFQLNTQKRLQDILGREITVQPLSEYVKGSK